MYIRLKSGEPFGFAGLYNVWTSPDGEKDLYLYHYHHRSK